MDRRSLGVVIAAFIAQGLAIGATVGSFSLFVRPVSEAFGASTLQLSAGVSLLTLTLAACGVPIGMWLDRGSPRTVMFTGCAILATGLLLASQAESLLQLAALCVFTGTGIPMMGPLTTAAVVGKAADEQRGRALGIANLGVPVGGVAFALTAGFTLATWDWRTTLQCFALVVLGMGLPAVALGIPGDLGGATHEGATSVGAVGGWTAKRLLASKTFWLMALVPGIGLGTATGWAVHVAPFLNDLGASSRYSGAVVGGMQAAMGIGTLVLGSLTDRRPGASILAGVLSVQLAGFALLLAGFGLTLSTFALLASGVATGGFVPVLAHLLAERFGAESLGRAMGLASLALLPFGFGLPMIGGALRDASGDYTRTLLLCGALIALSMSTLVALRRRLAREESFA